MSQRVFYSVDAYRREGTRLHPGQQGDDWEFTCPKCGKVHAIREWLALGFPRSRAARMCLDCGYENDGKLPILVKDLVQDITDSTFEFARFLKPNVVASRPKGGLGLF